MLGRFSRLGIGLLAVLLATALLPVAATSAYAADLFFSEYIEGSSNNKALEIYNGTSAAVDLAAGAYDIQMYFNGSATAGLTIALTGTVAGGEVHVVAHSSANATILAQADQTNGSGWFNGDDAVVLRKGGVAIDVIGQIGFDPGTEWGSGLTGTADNTLRRKAAICAGDPNGSDVFDPSVGWDGYAQDTLDGLGAHTSDCMAPPPPADPKINEFSASTVGTDVEYVEIIGDPSIAYSAYTVLEIEGDSGTSAGTIDEVIAVGTTDANGFYLANLPSNALENGTLTLLLVKDFTGSAATDLDGDNDGAFDTTPWSAIVDAVAVNDGGAGDLTYGVPSLGVAYDGMAFAPGGASRIPDGTDTDTAADWMRNDFDLAGIPTYVGTPVLGEALNTPGATNQAYVPLEPVINEFVANHTGTDTVEYVEVFGDPGKDYSAYTVLEIEGDSGTAVGTIDEVIAVGTTDASGIWVTTPFLSNSIENGTMTLLLVKDFTGALSNDLDTNDDGTFDTTPWSAIVDAVAVNDGGASDFTFGVPALASGYDGVGTVPGGASRIPDGTDTDTAADWMRNDFDLAGIPTYVGTPVLGEALNTPGAANQAYVPAAEQCGDPYTPIYQVQGNGLTSPLAGTEVAVEGIVVGDFQTGGLNGYHLQDFPGDADPATSDGVFIYAPGGTDVAAGDRVRVRGAVSEYNGLTEITAGTVWVCSSGNAYAATPLSLPVTTLDDFEKYEGMLVTLPQTLFISEFFDFDRYGEIVLAGTRQNQPTAVAEPGAAAIALAATNALDRITLDDGRTAQNPDPARHPNGLNFDLTNRFRGGDTLTDVTGAMDYSFGKYRIQPTQGATYAAVNPRPAAPDEVGGTLTVASFNVLNYFTTLGSRGANDADEFTRQRTKIFAALAAIDADVVGLIEIENNTAAIEDLVAGLNALVGAGTYDYIDTGAYGTDEIKQAIIYKPATVTPRGDYALLTSAVDARFIDTKNRPVLAQTFEDNAGHGVFTVAVNHLKSKGSDCNDVGDPDLGDGAGNCNLTRKVAAEAMVDWLAADPTGSGDGDFLIVGDLNSYDKEDPIDVLVAGGYTDLLALYQGEYAYTYLFDGQLGYLDHALAGADLLGEVTGATAWHINADEPDLLDYDTTYKEPAQDALYEPNAYRSSDHDPIIVGLDLDFEGAPASFGKTWPLDGATRRPLSLLLDWEEAFGAISYEYCIDATDDDACADWVSTGTATGALVTGLDYGTTYYWQARAVNGEGATYADGAETAFWSFTTHVLEQMSFRSLGTYDGWVLERDEDSGRGGSIDAAGMGRVGDDATDAQYRSILHFDTTRLPDRAVITHVSLRVKGAGITGTDPLGTHGRLWVDLRSGAFHDDRALEPFDFHAVGSRGNAAWFRPTPVDDWYRAPLKPRFYNQVNRIGNTQFRLRFAIDDNDNGVADFLEFLTGDAATAADRPALIVTYYVP